MLRFLAKSFSAGVVFAIGFGSVLAVANNVPYFTGPTGSNPIDSPITTAGINQLIQAINVANGVWTANGSVATAMSSLGPTGSHVTIQEWLAIQDQAGVTRYVPGF